MAQHQQPDHSGAAITSLKVQPYQPAEIILTSPAIDADGWLSINQAQAGDETAPALSWSGPLEVVSWALVVEDPDAPQDQPVLHWLMWNIPGAWTSLPAGLDKVPHPEGGHGLVQGLNSHGRPGWLGMAPTFYLPPAGSADRDVAALLGAILFTFQDPGRPPL